jgi:hypothetical protein
MQLDGRRNEPEVVKAAGLPWSFFLSLISVARFLGVEVCDKNGSSAFEGNDFKRLKMERIFRGSVSTSM